MWLMPPQRTVAQRLLRIGDSGEPQSGYFAPLSCEASSRISIKKPTHRRHQMCGQWVSCLAIRIQQSKPTFRRMASLGQLLIQNPVRALVRAVVIRTRSEYIVLIENLRVRTRRMTILARLRRMSSNFTTVTNIGHLKLLWLLHRLRLTTRGARLNIQPFSAGLSGQWT